MVRPIPVATDLSPLLAAAERAVRAVPPAWPLASSVAVNPFLGQTHETLADAGARLARVSQARVTLPRAEYCARIERGEIADADLAAALAGSPLRLTVTELKAHARVAAPARAALPTVAQLASEVSGVDWPGLVAERFGAWAAGHFDEGQALWAAPRGKGVYAAWRAAATHDLTPEIAGLSHFAAFVADAPESAEAVLIRTADALGLRDAAAETYFHQLLMTLGGWSQFARYKLWQAELAGGQDATATDFLAIRLVWEAALFARHADRISARWRAVVEQHAAPIRPDHDLLVDAVLQEAAERAAQRRIAETLSAPVAVEGADVVRPALQAAFCIDVRSEVFRRALETVSPQVRTLGFAGFFGLTAAHRRFASDVTELRLPVLLNPALTTCSGGPELDAADRSARYKARAKRAWGRFKLAAVSSFAFVEATGPVYALRLLRSALGAGGHSAKPEPAPRFAPALELPARVRTAATVLRAMSLTRGFAPLVLLVGHGANVVNNPHASALHCGACGGYSGDVNARLLASLLNDPKVRAGLAAAGIEIPPDTLFLGGLHDTTTDGVTLYADDAEDESHAGAIAQARTSLGAAGVLARAERALRLPGATAANLSGRSRDWAEVRPEWGLAGCKAFIAAPRSRTAGRSLEGRAFLHDYDWRSDRNFSVLELILTAPVVVASWISLQYYGSTVAPDVFGGGNKLLHNVTGGIGVVEGNGGLLRAGLPWQSVHDGAGYVHDPLRLTVCIEAPREAMTDILARHAGVRALFDNRWLHLFAMDEAGALAWRYAGDLKWTRETHPAAGPALELKAAG